MALLLSSMSMLLCMLQMQTPQLIRAKHRWDAPTLLVEPSRPKKWPRRVRDLQPVTIWDRLRGIKRTRCVPRAIASISAFATLTFGRSLIEVQAGNIIPPPLPYPLPTHLLSLHLVSQRARAPRLFHRVIERQIGKLTAQPSEQG